MTEITEGELTFSFPNGCEAIKYDDWTFHRMRFYQVAGGSKAADILCLDGDVAWLIEIKDFRRSEKPIPSKLSKVVAIKIRDTLSGLAAAYANADDEAEKDFARRAIETGAWRVVLHLEQPGEPAGLFQKPISLANMRMALRQNKRLKAVDPNLLVMDMESLADVPWSVHGAHDVEQND